MKYLGVLVASLVLGALAAVATPSVAPPIAEFLMCPEGSKLVRASYGGQARNKGMEAVKDNTCITPEGLQLDQEARWGFGKMALLYVGGFALVLGVLLSGRGRSRPTAPASK